MPDVTTETHWAANPVNPFDVNYDGDHDGWYDRTSFDVPALQGEWDDKDFTPYQFIIQAGQGNLPFTNLMEWNNETRPDLMTLMAILSHSIQNSPALRLFLTTSIIIYQMAEKYSNTVLIRWIMTLTEICYRTGMSIR
jgi:hypothetical protein